MSEAMLDDLRALARAWQSISDTSVCALDLDQRDYRAGLLVMLGHCADDLRGVLDKHGALP